MIGIDSLNTEISDLESKEPSYAVMEKLAWMYVIRDHLGGMAAVSQSSAPQMSGSEFLSACSGCDMKSLFSILDEHMEAIQVIHPREFQTLIRKIQLLKSI